MALRSFNKNDLTLLSDALDISEDVTGNFFKFSLGQWKRHRYEVRTLKSLAQDEIRPNGFAFLNKHERCENDFGRASRDIDFYSICLQDHMILNALKRDKDIRLLSLLVYIFTHELVHIVRFSNFMKNFEASGEEKEKEEKTVHATTYDILKNLAVPKLDHILDLYQNHRVYEMIAIQELGQTG